MLQRSRQTLISFQTNKESKIIHRTNFFLCQLFSQTHVLLNVFNTGCHCSASLQQGLVPQEDSICVSSIPTLENIISRTKYNEIEDNPANLRCKMPHITHKGFNNHDCEERQYKRKINYCHQFHTIVDSLLLLDFFL